MKAKIVFFEINSHKLSDWYSYIIKFFTYISNLKRHGFLFTHVGIVVNGILYEATEKGVECRKYSYQKESQNYIVKEYEVELSKTAIEFLKQQLSCNYAYIGALISVCLANTPILLKPLGSVVVRILQFLNRNQRGWFCSELVMAVLMFEYEHKYSKNNALYKGIIDYIHKKYNGRHGIIKMQKELMKTNETVNKKYISERLLPMDLFHIIANLHELELLI